jgi:hypothetical protein
MVRLLVDALNRAADLRNLRLIDSLCDRLPSWMKESSEAMLRREIEETETRLLKERNTVGK